MPLDRRAFIPEVTRGMEAPLQRPNHPVLQALYVRCHRAVRLGVPRRKVLTVLLEAVDRRVAQRTNKVDGLLQAQIVLAHDDCDHVVCVPAGVFNPV